MLTQTVSEFSRLGGGGSICIANQFPAGAYAAGPEMVLGEPAQ